MLSRQLVLLWVEAVVTLMLVCAVRGYAKSYWVPVQGTSTSTSTTGEQAKLSIKNEYMICFGNMTNDTYIYIYMRI
jgi:hypothetical protein